jgi:tRNA(Ile)-lysidine synthase
VVRIERSGEEASVPDAVVLPIPGRVRFGDYEVVCEFGEPLRGSGILDRAALDDPLLVRGWRAGDRMAPLGLGGTKSLQDLFTARRVPRRRRLGLPVVESAGEIAWVPEVATSERFKVTEHTVQAVWLEARRPNHGARASAPA